MTIREELKKLVAKLGGTPSKEDQTAELIHKVTDNVSGGGSGGGGGLVVNIAIEASGTMETYTLDKTWQEIFDAMSSGQTVILTGEKEYRGRENYAVTNCYKSDSPADAETPFILCTYYNNGPVSNYAQVFKCALATDYPECRYSFD